MNFVEILNALEDKELQGLFERISDVKGSTLTRDQIIEILDKHEKNQLTNGERFYRSLDKK